MHGAAQARHATRITKQLSPPSGESCRVSYLEARRPSSASGARLWSFWYPGAGATHAATTGGHGADDAASGHISPGATHAATAGFATQRWGSPPAHPCAALATLQEHWGVRNLNLKGD